MSTELKRLTINFLPQEYEKLAQHSERDNRSIAEILRISLALAGIIIEHRSQFVLFDPESGEIIKECIVI